MTPEREKQIKENCSKGFQQCHKCPDTDCGDNTTEMDRVFDFTKTRKALDAYDAAYKEIDEKVVDYGDSKVVDKWLTKLEDLRDRVYRDFYNAHVYSFERCSLTSLDEIREWAKEPENLMEMKRRHRAEVDKLKTECKHKEVSDWMPFYQTFSGPSGLAKICLCCDKIMERERPE